MQSTRRPDGTVILLFGAILALWPCARVSAEPIQATYEINIYQRFQYSPVTVVPFFSSFAFTVEFDRASTLDKKPSYWVRDYRGPYNFSSLPPELVVATPPPNVEPTSAVQVVDTWTREAEDRYIRSSVISSFENIENNVDPFYERGFVLGNGSQAFTAPPLLTTSSFLEYLGGQTALFIYRGYSFTPSTAGNTWAENSFAYVGSSRLLGYVIPGGELPPDAPVPEPATLLLVGSGLVGLVYRRRRAAQLLRVSEERPSNRAFL